MSETSTPEEIKRFTQHSELAYGENRDQSPAFSYADPNCTDPLALHQFTVRSGKLSYIAATDVDSALTVLCRLAAAFLAWRGLVPHIVIVCKHGNPCGAAFDWNSPAIALEKALRGDPLAVMGGELVCNFAIDDELANVTHRMPLDVPGYRTLWGLDVVAATDFSEGAIALLGKKERRKLLSNPALVNPRLPEDSQMWRLVRGGALPQRAPHFLLHPNDVTWFAGLQLKLEQFENLLLAWAVCWTGSSNTVTLANNGMLIGRGFGQQDRIQCVRLCLQHAWRARHDTTGSVFASDGFFPYAQSTTDIQELAQLLYSFQNGSGGIALDGTKDLDKIQAALSRCDTREGPQLLADAGCIGGVVPADGKALAKVQEFFASMKLRVAYVHADHRGFAKH